MPESAVPLGQATVLALLASEGVTWLDCPGPDYEEIGAAAWAAVQHLGLRPAEEAAVGSLYLRRTAQRVAALPGVVHWFPESRTIGLQTSPSDMLMGSADSTLLDVALLLADACRHVPGQCVRAILAVVVGEVRAAILMN